VFDFDTLLPQMPKYMIVFERGREDTDCASGSKTTISLHDRSQKNQTIAFFHMEFLSYNLTYLHKTWHTALYFLLPLALMAFENKISFRYLGYLSIREKESEEKTRL